MASIVLRVNGQDRQLPPDSNTTLQFALRDDLGLTGTKFGCGVGQCGCCTVLIDGVAHRSCLTPVGSVAGKEITTIEGLADGERLHPLQQAFVDCEAMQCGYCTPGMIMQSAGLIRRDPSPSEAEIRGELEGNICRCGTQNRIVAAVQKAAHTIGAVAKGDRHA